MPASNRHSLWDLMVSLCSCSWQRVYCLTSTTRHAFVSIAYCFPDGAGGTFFTYPVVTISEKLFGSPRCSIAYLRKAWVSASKVAAGSLAVVSGMTTGFTGVARCCSMGGAVAATTPAELTSAVFFPQPDTTKTSPLINRPQISLKYGRMISKLIEPQLLNDGYIVPPPGSASQLFLITG